jgi:hypothetical protein
MSSQNDLKRVDADDGSLSSSESSKSSETNGSTDYDDKQHADKEKVTL